MFKTSERLSICAGVVVFSVTLVLAPIANADTVSGEVVNPSPGPLPLTLKSSIDYALKNNRGVQNASLQRNIQKFSLEVSKDECRPKSNIRTSTLTGTDDFEGTNVAASTALRIPTGGQFELRWSKPHSPILDSEMYRLGYKQPLLRNAGITVGMAPWRLAKLNDQSSEISFRNAVESIVVSVIRAYRSLIRANRQLVISEKALERTRSQLMINQALIKAGKMAAREILQSQAEIARRELALVQSRNNQSRANYALVDVLDMDSSVEIRLQGISPVRLVELDVEASIEIALKNWPGYLQALIAVKRAGLGLKVARNNRLWDLSLNADVLKQTSGETHYEGNLQLSIPIRDRSTKPAEMRANAEVLRSRRRLEELEQFVSLAVRQAVRDVEVGYRQVELARQARELSEQKLQIEREKLRQGLSSTFQVSLFETDLVDAQNDEVNQEIDYLDALTSFDQTLGITLDTWNIRIEAVGQ